MDSEDLNIVIKHEKGAVLPIGVNAAVDDQPENTVVSGQQVAISSDSDRDSASSASGA
ncbi:hypothetical protein [Haloarcula argentinensis]|uniref:Uncharacterized protein n=1 Tax=Haloarcula argentinensis TaxID=43776 RepID=A0A847UJE1_HALAR|nr:hypothetical protein [Haloarcula argentinensis]NLV13639.1 hypothetical protein [Haloarcula argentinensis]